MGFRLAPEHPFPTGVEDCYAVARALLQGAVPSIPPENITLIGDSSGANMAAAVSLMARDRGEFLPRRQILLYPSTAGDHSDDAPFPSLRESGRDYMLTTKHIRQMESLYLASEADKNNPYYAPLAAKNLSNQPRTLIITAEHCPLRDEGEWYGEKLRLAGNRVEIHRIEGAVHAFIMLPARFRSADRALMWIDGFLNGGEGE